MDFKGVLINGFSQVGNSQSIVYYDQPQYLVEKLDVPLYLHPRNLYRRIRGSMRAKNGARPNLGIRRFTRFD